MASFKHITMMVTSSQPGTTFSGQGDAPSVTLFFPDSVPYAPKGCLVVRSDGYKPWENPHDLVSHKADYLIKIILNATITPVLFLFGFPANILNAVVFYRQGLRERINMCLFVLSLADLVALTAQFFLNFEQMYRTLFNVQTAVFQEYTIGFTGFMWVSQFLTCVISCERCFCVFSPLKAQKYLKTSTMAWVILVTSVFLVGGLAVIAGYKHTFTCVFDPVTNETGMADSFTSFYLEHKHEFDIIDVFIYSVIFTIALVFLIITTSVLTILKLYQASRWRQQNAGALAATTKGDGEPTKDSSHLSSKEVAITKMLVASSFLFIFCFAPVVIVQLSMYLVSDLSASGYYYNLISVLWRIISQLRMINCSLNFIVYYRMGSRFRMTLGEVLRCTKS